MGALLTTTVTIRNTWSPSSAKMSTEAQTKKFQRGERVIPSATDKALKYYPAEDEQVMKKARKTQHPYKPRASLQPGAVLILLAGRFRGKRVVLLKTLDNGVLLVTGPFKVNGVPLRRVNARYVIATRTTVPLSGLDNKTLEKVSARDKKADKKGSEEAFFQQGEKPQKKELAAGRAEDQKAVDKAILEAIKKEHYLQSYLASNFSLRKGDRPHEMVF